MKRINLRKTMVLLFTILLCISVSGCDSGLEIVGMEIEKFPDRIVYFSGIDSKVDLTGGVVNYIYNKNPKRAVDMGDGDITVSHNIDFNKPGVYVVKLERNETAYCKFAVEVINKNDL